MTLKEHPREPTCGFAPLNGLNMYYEIHGTGKPLILIHGGGSAIGTTFGRVIPYLSANHQVVAVELQAHGRTADRETPLSFAQDADDVAELLNFLEIKQADIFGFSNGGTTALQLVIRHPGLVNKLVIASAISRRTGTSPLFWEFMQKATFADMPQALKDAFLGINPDEEALIRMHDRDLYRMQHFTDIPDRQLQAITAETLIVGADRDVPAPEHLLELSHLIPNARLMILPGGHGEYLGEITTLESGNRSYLYATALISDFLRRESQE